MDVAVGKGSFDEVAGDAAEGASGRSGEGFEFTFGVSVDVGTVDGRPPGPSATDDRG